MQTPPFISTADSESFAEYTLLRRLPKIIDQVVSDNRVKEPVMDELFFLKNEIKEGTIRSPFESDYFNREIFEDLEIMIWDDQLRIHEGKSWLNVPWYFAEALFYFKVLVAFHYFESNSEFFFKDPFQKAKDKELLSKSSSLRIAGYILNLIKEIDSLESRICTLIHTSLWGNRIDLSNLKIASGASDRILKSEKNNLLIDHSRMLTRKLLKSDKIAIIADNCGTELVCDLILSENLLRLQKNSIVKIHVNKYPMFVSDAMPKDVDQALDALIRCNDESVSEVGKRLQSLIQEKRLIISDHFFWNTPLHFNDFTDDLRYELSKMDIVLLKGDVNYRRLLGDRKWIPWTNMADIARYFPSSFSVLRTMKSEIVVDIASETFNHLKVKDPDWMINGERGIVRMVLL